VNPRGIPQRIRGGHVANQRAHVRWHGWAPAAVSAFPQNSRKLRRCHAITVSGLTMGTADPSRATSARATPTAAGLPP